MQKIILLILLLSLSSLACFSSGSLAAQATITPTATAAAAITSAPILYIPSPTGTGAPECVVMAETLNVRSKPEGLEESNVLAWIYSGDTVTILDARGAWLYIRAGSVNGWINSKFCRGK